MSTKKGSSLRHVPRLVFEHFANMETLRNGQFNAYNGEHFVSVALSKRGEDEPNKPFTLVCLDSCPLRGDYLAQLMVYNYPAELEQFEPNYDKYRGDPVMTIRLHVDNPLKCPRTWDRWQQGRGFWIEEHLVVSFKPNDGVEITSKNNCWEFEFFLEIQRYALELVRKLPIIGHWESEWDPEGKYMEKPNAW
jgi:hypothetical protein